MKKLITIVAALLIHSVLVAVTPPVSDKISYQAVVRNSSNALVINHLVGMKVSILYGSASGSVVYSETHTPTTNANGLINISIGSGNVVSGNYQFIEWGTGTHFIKTEIDPTGGTAYTITATSELLSVPYALFANYTKTAMNTQGLLLPMNINANLNSYPLFSITNTGTGLQTISGISTSGSGIYGETKSDNSPGVFGIGSGSGTSSGVMGKTGELASEVLPGNVGVQGRSDAHIGVAGTALSGTGGYFSSRTGLALFTKGGLKLTGIGEAAGSVLTSDAAGTANWQVPPWLVSGSKIYNTSGPVGIGTNDANASLHVKSGTAEIARFEFSADSKWISLFQGNTRKGLIWSTYDDIKVVSDAGGVGFRTGGIDRIITTKEGKTGIGDTTPEATLDVEGTVVIGSGGKIFSEIREITGTTSATLNYNNFSYPAGYTIDNIRVLSCEINYAGTAWVGLAGSSNNSNEIAKVFYYLSSSSIWIYYQANSNFQNRAFRMMVMKVE